MNQEKIGQFIKDIRIKNKLTQKEFAEKFGVTYQAVSKWENGKNLPDINILKDICKEYSISLDEVLIKNTPTRKSNKSKLKLLIISLFIILIIIISILFIHINKSKEQSFEFKTLTSTCSNFKVTGSIAYNDTKSSIYISHVNYCGGDDNTSYKILECTLYEVNNDIKKEISKYNYNGNKGKTLEEFLSNVSFHIDDYEKVCKTYQENSFLLEIDAINDNEEIFTHKIPLKLNDNCK